MERLKERSGDIAQLGEEIAEVVRDRGGPVAREIADKGAQATQRALERGMPVAQILAARGADVAEQARERGAAAGKVLAVTGVVAGKAVAHGAERAKQSAQGARDRAAQRLTGGTGSGRRERTSMIGKVFNRFTLGFGLGYVLGARAGRERYDQIVRGWSSFVGNATVHQVAERGRDMVSDASRSVGQEIHSRMDRQTIQDVMTSNPRTVKASAPVSEAAEAMRDIDSGAVVVVDDSDRVAGILTDRDIAVRSIAEGRDPSSTKVSAIATMELATLSPSDTVKEAVRLMREKAVRRLPVVDGGRAVGIVSIGDLAIERDSHSALADISAAAPNTQKKGRSGGA
jgi:CBS domain-containing protein